MQTRCESFIDFFKARISSSSTGHRNTERLNAGLQLTTSMFSDYGPAVISTKAAQTMTSVYAFLREDTHQAEKLLHLSQALLAAAQITINITLYTQSDNCAIMSRLCKAANICELVYQGILLTGWGASEVSKGSTNATVAPNLETVLAP